MNHKNQLTVIVLAIAVLAGAAAFCAIFPDFGTGPFSYESIRGRSIEIYGKGVYQHMPADVAIQGIAQDYVTLFLAIPLLLIALIGYRYLGFLSLLMTALTAKIIAMAWHGANVIPVIFIIPTFNIITVLSTYWMIRNVRDGARQ